MCTPTALIASTVAISAVTNGVGFLAKQQQANNQAAYQAALQRQREQQIAQNALAARQAQADQNRHEFARFEEEQQARAQDAQAKTLEAQRRRSAARVSSAEGGVSGLSVDSLIADFNRQEAVLQRNFSRNTEFAGDQVGRNLSGIRAQAVNRTNSIQPYLARPVNGPSPIAAGLNVIGDGLNAYGRYGGVGVG